MGPMNSSKNKLNSKKKIKKKNWFFNPMSNATVVLFYFFYNYMCRF